MGLLERKMLSIRPETLSSKSPYIRNTNYVEIPDSIDLNNIVVDWKDVHDWADECRERFAKDYEEDAFAHVDSAYKEFRKSSVKEVNYLVKEFECRKSADAYARAATSRTGVLDTTKLHTYRYNEDLFKKVTVIPDGKNHGLLFVLDWSGSMQYELLATIKQLLNLTTFCRKVQIPFEVYAFTNEWRIVRAIKGEDFESDRYSSVEEGKVWIDPINFNLMNIISSRSNNRDYERQCMNIWREVYRFTYHTWYRETPGLGLSGTPLNEAIVSLNYIIPEFKRQNDLQKVNVCILTDGDSWRLVMVRKSMRMEKKHNVLSEFRRTARCVIVKLVLSTLSFVTLILKSLPRLFLNFVIVILALMLLGSVSSEVLILVTLLVAMDIWETTIKSTNSGKKKSLQ